MQGRRSARATSARLVHPLKARLQHTVDDDGFKEHRMRPHPQGALAVERAVDHQGLQRLAVTRRTDHLVRPFFPSLRNRQRLDKTSVALRLLHTLTNLH